MSNTVDLFATSSRFAIAAAIIYFAYQLGQINDSVPAVIETVDQVSQHIGPTLEEVKVIRAEIAEVRKLIPVVVAEVAEIRGQIPLILTQIDPILKRVDTTVVVVDEIQQQFPLIFESTDKIIAEVSLTRAEINPTLDRLDDLVEDAYLKATDAINAADEAGKKASEGAVKGFFTGLIKLPFDLVGTLASPLVGSIDKDVAKQLTEKDIELMAEAGNQAYESKKVNKEYHWENPDSGNSGTITLVRNYQLKNAECIELKTRITSKDKQLMDDEVNNYCKDAEGEWKDAKDI